MTGASGIAAAQPRNRVPERERQLLIFAFCWRMTASDSSQWQLRARSRRNPDVEAVVHHLRMAMAGLYSEPAIFH